MKFVHFEVDKIRTSLIQTQNRTQKYPPQIDQESNREKPYIRRGSMTYTKHTIKSHDTLGISNDLDEYNTNWQKIEFRSQ